MFGGLFAGMLTDFLGRKPVLGIADVIFIGGAIGQAVCHTVWSMVRLLARVYACPPAYTLYLPRTRLAAVSSSVSA